ncbi:retron St85 family effector protein [Alcaligenes ammonioxydans]|uniref:retron St85 family effector protein n=1 Tax=Alcaligenes ammonioxydans TaxID=2582914 RepID=UPI001F05B9D7|nr:retron St85 family effector protein [Alcaligenes ammonioxydans]MCH1879075.1 retron St85 family effector protein [Alcaligenes ammonioxydans]
MKFDDQLIEEFQHFEHSKFTVSFLPPRIFLCGGPVDVKATFPLSARQRLIAHFSAHDYDFYRACIQAENFNDYFKEGAYSDLLEFEADIASIATLIVICLESPGSLVELGLFCMDPNTVGKLLVLVTQEELDKEDSFIFLGPLQNIQRVNSNSVLSYPWPKNDSADYEHMSIMVGDIKQKLDKMLKTQNFSVNNPAHIALLIHDIVMLAYPITFSEIELALVALNIDVDSSAVSRLLYLLQKIELVSCTTYSNVKYYFDKPDSKRRIKFGVDSKGRTRDTPAIIMGFRKTYILKDDEQSRKRALVLKHITKLKQEMK